MCEDVWEYLPRLHYNVFAGCHVAQQHDIWHDQNDSPKKGTPQSIESDRGINQVHTSHFDGIIFKHINLTISPSNNPHINHQFNSIMKRRMRMSQNIDLREEKKKNDLTRGRTWNLLMSTIQIDHLIYRSQAPCHWAIRPDVDLFDEKRAN